VLEAELAEAEELPPRTPPSRGTVAEEERKRLAEVREAVRREVREASGDGEGVRRCGRSSRWFRHWREAASPSRGHQGGSLAGAAMGLGLPALGLTEAFERAAHEVGSVRAASSRGGSSANSAASSSPLSDTDLSAPSFAAAHHGQEGRDRAEEFVLLCATLMVRRWVRMHQNDAPWWRERAHFWRSCAETRASQHQVDQQPVAWAQRVTISTDAVSSMSESDLDAVQHRLEDGLEAIRGELKLRLHREKNRLRSERDQTLCLACADAEKSILLTPCNHICVCEACGERLDRCPICMCPVEGRVKVYL